MDDEAENVMRELLGRMFFDFDRLSSGEPARSCMIHQKFQELFAEVDEILARKVHALLEGCEGFRRGSEVTFVNACTNPPFSVDDMELITCGIPIADNDSVAAATIDPSMLQMNVSEPSRWFSCDLSGAGDPLPSSSSVPRGIQNVSDCFETLSTSSAHLVSTQYALESMGIQTCLTGHVDGTLLERTITGGACVAPRERGMHNTHSIPPPPGPTQLLLQKPIHRTKETLRRTRRKPAPHERRQIVAASPASLPDEIAEFAQNSVQSAEIYQALAKGLSSPQSKSAPFLARLAFGLGSPEAIIQLSDACRAIRKSRRPPIPRSTDTVADTLSAIELLDISDTANAILRRYQLLALHDHRTKLRERHEDRRTNWIEKKRGGRNIGGSKKSSTQVLDHMMHEAYQQVTESDESGPRMREDYIKKRTSLKNKLAAAGNWYRLRESFSIGLLALVPVGGLYEIHNQRSVGCAFCSGYGLIVPRVESLPEPVFTHLLGVLSEFRGDYLHKLGEAASKVIESAVFQHREPHRACFMQTSEAFVRNLSYDSTELVRVVEHMHF
ncbi:hypothetical protein LTR66_002488 [Elasticomyces elasticus]|nr:hypothetical protein LTR66_002488 [Elasticomyces elasticus]